jgi:hypothetical protein
VRRTQPNWISRLRRAATPAGKTFAATTTTAATALGIAAGFGIVLPLTMIYWAVGFCVAPPVGVFVWKSRSQHLPDVIIDEDNTEGIYRAHYCSAGDLREANGWTKMYYRDEYVSDEVAESWRAKTPHSFVGLYNDQNRLCAAFGIIAIEPSFMNQFVKGRVIDNTLAPEDLLDEAKAKKSSDLYISGVVVRDPDTAVGSRRACVMVWAMIRFFESQYGIRRKRNLYALAVTKQSKNLLLKAGFDHHNGPSERRDRLELYVFNLSKDRLTSLVQRIGDHSNHCRLEFV